MFTIKYKNAWIHGYCDKPQCRVQWGRPGEYAGTVEPRNNCFHSIVSYWLIVQAIARNARRTANLATCYSATDLDGNRATVQASDELTMDGNHRAACLALCKKMGWKGTLVEGFVKGGRVYVWRQSGRNCADEVVAV